MIASLQTPGLSSQAALSVCLSNTCSSEELLRAVAALVGYLRGPAPVQVGYFGTKQHRKWQ